MGYLHCSCLPEIQAALKMFPLIFKLFMALLKWNAFIPYPLVAKLDLWWLVRTPVTYHFALLIWETLNDDSSAIYSEPWCGNVFPWSHCHLFCANDSRHRSGKTASPEPCRRIDLRYVFFFFFFFFVVSRVDQSFLWLLLSWQPSSLCHMSVFLSVSPWC